MSFGVSIAILAFVIAIIGAVVFMRLSPRRKSRRRRTREPVDPLADPPTITHYGHG
jgi:hypothetical protein